MARYLNKLCRVLAWIRHAKLTRNGAMYQTVIKDKKQGNKLASSFLIMAVSILICLLLSEVAVRSVFGDKYAPRPKFYDKVSELGWAPSPNLSATYHGGDFSMHVRTDAGGFRLGSRGPVDEDSPIVVLVGDSYSFGWGVSDHETFASYLDEHLANDGRAPSRLVNLGVGGYGTLAGAARLRRLFEEDSSAQHRLRAVLIMHSHNDMADNVGYVLYRSGFRVPRTERSGSTSASHLLNLFRHARIIWEASLKADPEEDSPRGVTSAPERAQRDVMFAYPLRWTDKKSGEVMIGNEEFVQFESLTKVDYSSKLTQNQGSLTDIQLLLMQRSIDELNCAFSSSPVVVVHVAVHFAPDWYVEPIERMVEKSETCGNDIRFGGRINVPREIRAFNNHSGGRFTPETNRIYAEQLFTTLVKALNN